MATYIDLKSTADLVTQANTQSEALQTTIAALGTATAPTTQDMLNMQSAINQLEVYTSLTTTLTKTTADVLKGIIQKMG